MDLKDYIETIRQNESILANVQKTASRGAITTVIFAIIAAICFGIATDNWLIGIGVFFGLIALVK